MEILDAEREAGVDELWSEASRRRVARLCATITGDATAADDLAQETLLEAWRCRHRLVDPTGARPWLDAIARNVCLRHGRRRGRLAGREVVTEQPGDHGDHPAYDELAEVLERQELAELLDRALALLPAPTREALVAAYVDELGPREIAGRLALSPEAVSMRLTRGRARIRELLETDLADEPVAQVWVGRYGAAWRPTRLPCPTCGRPMMTIRRDRRAGVVELRCDACEPSGLAARWRLDNPEHGPRLAQAQRPSTVVRRMAAWGHGWWPRAISAGHADCTRCGADVPVVPYLRPEPDDVRVARGWHATCPRCGEVLSTSLLGLLLAYPETRALIGRRPGAHAVPTRPVEHAGRDALLVAMHDDASGDGVELLVDDVTTRPLAVVVA